MLNYKDEKVQFEKFAKAVLGFIAVYFAKEVAGGALPDVSQFMHAVVGVVLLVQLTQVVPELITKIVALVPKKDKAIVDGALLAEKVALEEEVSKLKEALSGQSTSTATGMGNLPKNGG